MFLLAFENIRFSSLFAALDVSRETSPATKSEEKRMFSQATFSSLYSCCLISVCKLIGFFPVPIEAIDDLSAYVLPDVVNR